MVPKWASVVTVDADSTATTAMMMFETTQLMVLRMRTTMMMLPFCVSPAVVCLS